MIQYEAIKLVSRKIIDNNEVDCILLEDSINSMYTDAVMIICVDDNQKERLINDLKGYLSYYDDVMHIEVSNKDEIDIYTVVFDNAVRLKIKVMDIKHLLVTDNTKVIYDKFNQLTKDKVILNLYAISPLEVGELINSFSSKLFDLKDSYYSKRRLDGLQNVIELSKMLSVFLHYTYDKEHAKLGEEGLITLLSEEVKTRYQRIINKICFDNLIECAKLIIVMLDPYIVNLPIEVVQFINIDYYLLAKRIILNI